MFAAAAVSAIAIAATAGGARAGGSASLNLQLFPTSLLPNGAGAALATFTNNGPSTLNHVVVTVTLPADFVFNQAGSSTGCTGATKAHVTTVTCPLVGGGSILLGSSVLTTVAYTAPGAGTNLQFSSSATVNSQTKGKPNGNPGNSPFTITGNSPKANVISDLADGQSSCTAGGGTLGATSGGQSIGVTAGANSVGLTCTPITTGIDNSAEGIFFVKMPPLTSPATVTLTFADGNLPFATDTDGEDPGPPQYLHEYPNYPDTTTVWSVPACGDYVQSPNGPASIPTDPALPVSTDACISSVVPTDDSATDVVDEEPSPDFDQGTITLKVQGSSTGDSGFHGH
jgi:hypothetical protein